MRILYSFPHAIGAPGIGTTAAEEALGLLRRGHDVTVMVTSVHKDAPAFPKLITTMVLGGLRIPHRIMGMDRTMAYHDLQVAEHLRAKYSDYDVVHCWPGATLSTARMAKSLGLPALREVPNTHTENAYDVVGRLCDDLGIILPPGNSHRHNPTRLAREQAEYDAALRLLIPSDFAIKTFRDRGFRADKLLKHRYGFDPNKFSPAKTPNSGPLKAVFIGSIGPRKGLHVALEAWSQSQASENGRLSIYGRVEEGYRPVIEPYLSASGVELYEFTEDVNGVLQSNDVLLLPSFEEGSALVTYEAQGCGVIPLVSDAAGAVCVDGVTGFVHPAGDVDLLTAQLNRLCTEAGLRDTMRQAVLQQRDKLTWAAAAENLEECYTAALSVPTKRTKPDSLPVQIAKRALRDTFGVWPMMEVWNVLTMGLRGREVIRFENTEVARLSKTLKTAPEANIACIIPTYKRPQGVIEAINSILNQDRQDFVIVVVDDGAGLPTNIPDDPRIFAVSLSRNSKVLGLVRNVGIRLSKSKYVAFLDDDNTWTSNHLSLAIEALEKGNDLIYTAVRRRLHDGTDLDTLSKSFNRKRFCDEPPWVDSNAIVLRRSMLLPFSRLPRTKKTIPKEDWEFVWRVSRKAQVAHVPVATVEYLVNMESYYTNWNPGSDV